MAADQMPSAPEVVNYVISGSGYGLLVYFVNLLSRKKLAWWYQIEERDRLIEKAEKREAAAVERCKQFEEKYWAWKEITNKSLDVAQKQVESQ